MSAEQKSVPSKEIQKSVPSEQIQSEVEYAQQVQKQRMAAPPVSASSRGKPPRKIMVEQFAPECVGTKAKPAVFHPYWDSIVRHSWTINQGYEPVHGVTGYVEENGDRLYRIPAEIYTREIAAVKADSDRRLDDPDPESDKQTKAVRDKHGIVMERSARIPPGDPRHAAAASGADVLEEPADG